MPAAAAIPAHLDEPALQTELLIIGNPSMYPGQDGLWRYFYPHGWVKQPFPAAYWRWFGIAASPHNPDHWLLWGHPDGGGIAFDGSQLVGRLPNDTLTGLSPLWRTPDAGRTWINVGLSAPSNTWAADPHFQVAWSPTEPGAFTVMGYLIGRGGVYSEHFSITKERYALWYGAPGTITTQLLRFPGTDEPVRNGRFALALAQDGAVVVNASSSWETAITKNFRFGTVFTSTGLLQALGGGQELGDVSLEADPEAPATVYALERSYPNKQVFALSVTEDAHQQFPRRILDNVGGDSFTVARDGLYVAGRSPLNPAGGGVLRVTQALTSPVSRVVAVSDRAMGVIRADRQERRAVAAYFHEGKDLVVNHLDFDVWGRLGGARPSKNAPHKHRG